MLSNLLFCGLLGSIRVFSWDQQRLNWPELKYSSALITRLRAEFSLFLLFVQSSASSHHQSPRRWVWLWLMRDKISSHIHYISVSSSDHWCSAKYRKTINWHDYSPEQHISGFPSFAQFCSQSIWSQSVTESRPLNQNELRGFFTICIFWVGTRFFVDVRTYFSL